MNSDEEWDLVNGETYRGSLNRSGLLRIALLFGSIAVAFSLFLVPMLSTTGIDTVSPGVDRILTGSISKGSEYTLRRSVLQRDPSAYCIIRNDGTSTGSC